MGARIAARRLRRRDEQRRPGQRLHAFDPLRGSLMQRILIVEDEPEISRALEDDLRLEGYDVEVANDGPGGANRGKDPGFNLILLDVMLPGKDGFEVCREIRKAGVATPILFLT